MEWFEKSDISFTVGEHRETSSLANEVKTKTLTGNVAVFNLTAVVVSASASRQFRTKKDWVPSYPDTIDVLNKLHKDGWVVMIVSDYPDEKIIHYVMNKLVKMLKFQPLLAYSTERSLKRQYKLLLTEAKITKVEPASFYVGTSTDDIPGLAHYVASDMFHTLEVAAVPESKKPRLFITVGQQGAGKSTFSKALKKEIGGTIIARNAKKHLTEIKTALEKGKTVIFDATNPTAVNRAEIIKLGKTVKVIGLLFLRRGADFNAKRTGKDKVPNIALNKYSSSFEMPDEDEGFTEIIRIN